MNEADAFVKAVSENGTWIIATLSDINIDQDVVVAGEFHDKNDKQKTYIVKLPHIHKMRITKLLIHTR